MRVECRGPLAKLLEIHPNTMKISVGRWSEAMRLPNAVVAIQHSYSGALQRIGGSSRLGRKEAKREFET